MHQSAAGRTLLGEASGWWVAEKIGNLTQQAIPAQVAPAASGRREFACSNRVLIAYAYGS
jgi:hypothetical protein